MRKKSSCSVSARGADGPGRAGSAGSADLVAKVVIISVSKGDGRDQTRQGIPTRRRGALLCKFRPLPRVRQRSRTAAGMQRYSIISLARNALSGHERWQPAWRSPEPKPAYDVVIVGAGGHGLATAYFLAKEHGITNVAVLEKGWIGSGNAARNTTIIRSNYLLPGNERFYEHSMRLWEGLEQDLNYNCMVSQRGVLNLFHTDAARDAAARRGNSMRLHGVDAELLDREQVRAIAPCLDFENARFPIRGGLLQKRGGTARHDAVVWGYARAASARGVDIIQNCEVTGLSIENGAITGLQTTRGFIGAGKVGLAVAGNSSRLAAMAGMRLPI